MIWKRASISKETYIEQQQRRAKVFVDIHFTIMILGQRRKATSSPYSPSTRWMYCCWAGERGEDVSGYGNLMLDQSMVSFL